MTAKALPNGAKGLGLPLVDRSRIGGIYVVTASRLAGRRPLSEMVAGAVSGGAAAVQVREKELTAREMWVLAQDLGPAVRAAGALFLINGRVDVAMAAGADGVHLGADALPVGEARRLLGPGPVIGASVHSLDEAVAAVAEGADYLIFGHVFETGSKPGQCPRGTEALAEVCRAVSVPVLAVGGIAPHNLDRVRQAGAAGAAVMSVAMTALDPAAAVRVLADAWKGVPSCA